MIMARMHVRLKNLLVDYVCVYVCVCVFVWVWNIVAVPTRAVMAFFDCCLSMEVAMKRNGPQKAKPLYVWIREQGQTQRQNNGVSMLHRCLWTRYQTHVDFLSLCVSCKNYVMWLSHAQAEEEFNIEKGRLLQNEKRKVSTFFERREKQLELQRKMWVAIDDYH